MVNQIFTKCFLALFFTNMAVFLVFYALITTLPLYVTNELGGTEDAAGLLVTVFLVSAIIVRPFCGKLLDIYGKKKMLIHSLIFYFICSILYCFLKPFALLIALRFFQGIWFSILTTASGAIAADIVPAHRKGAGLGYFAMSTNLAVVLGPFLGLLIIQHFSYDVMFIVMALFVLVGALFAMSIDKDGLTEPNPDATLSFQLGDLIEKKAIPVAVFGLFVAFSYSSVLSFISLYAEEKDLLTAASYFYAVFAVAMLSIRPLTGKIYDLYGPKFVVLPAFIAFAVGLYLLAIMNSMVLLLLSAVFVGIGYGTLSTSLQAEAVQMTMKERSAYATATFFTLFDTGIALGSYIFGLIVICFDYAFIYIFSSLVACVLFLAYFIYSKKQQHSIKNIL